MAVAREVVAAAGDDIRSQPVGTGPYQLKEWKRASRIVLEANPHYRGIALSRKQRSATPRTRRIDAWKNVAADRSN